MNKIYRHIYTVKNLTISQICWRIFYKCFFYCPSAEQEISVAKKVEKWISSIQKSESIKNGNAVFLNISQSILSDSVWQDDTLSLLWRYNLHYFDYINSSLCVDDAHHLIHRWIKANPPCAGVGWEAYPTSLRIVNWIKWALFDNCIDDHMLQSLSFQAKFLINHLEYHLLANHLFANAKALVFAGLFFDDAVGKRCLMKGMALLEKQINEQILFDGGHFERSPMYHSIILEDMLDIINLFKVYHRSIPSQWVEKVNLMLVWLKSMIHPDGQIAFFNDSAFNIAPTFQRLVNYAIRLRIIDHYEDVCSVFMLNQSAFVRLENESVVLLADIGDIGPKYQPGHAHAEVLSFEMSIKGYRVLVNSGISEYNVSDLRLYQRGSSAHNALLIGNINSSDVWGSFRVANRANILRDELTVTPDSISAVHDGYLKKQGYLHKRTWSMNRSEIIIVDELLGKEKVLPVAIYFHFHPLLKIVSENDLITVYSYEGQFLVKFIFDGYLRIETINTNYYPEFGRSEANKTVLLHSDTARKTISTRIIFNES